VLSHHWIHCVYVNASSVVWCVSALALALVQELLAIEINGLRAHVSQLLDDGSALTTQHQPQRPLLVDDVLHSTVDGLPWIRL
jgi:hypothetical protein